MSSHFGWVDFAEDDRQKMLDVVKLFHEQDTRDELGIGSIRDAFADYFFPGTSTIQTRARYMLFVPWLYKELEKKGISSEKIAHRARQDEIKMIYALLKSDDTSGVIGKREKDGLQRLPSSIYWSGLGSWGIRLYHGSQNEYNRFLNAFHDQKYLIKSNDKEPGNSIIGENWDPGMPEPPDALLDYAEMALIKEEAIYLQERIQIKHRGSLLSFLVNYNTIIDVDFFWNHPIIDSLPDSLQKDIRHAQNFSETMHGAALLYNLMLAQARENEELIEDYEVRLDEWANSILSRRDELFVWNKDMRAFWLSSVFKEARIPTLTRTFVENWCNLIFKDDLIVSIAKNKDVQNLIRNREVHLKRARARLENKRALELWTGASGNFQLDFRWRTVETIVTDILYGLKKRRLNYA